MNASATWLDLRRADAQARFDAQGLPHRRIEDWKYSDLRSVVGTANDDAPAQWLIQALPRGVELFDLSVVDAPDWVRAHYASLPQNAMASSSAAHARSGFAVRVLRGQVIDETLRFALSGAGSTRVLIVLEENAALTIHETQDGKGFANMGVEFILGAQARLDHVRLSARSDAVQVEEYTIKIGRDGTYRAHFFSAGARLSRTELSIDLAAQGASAHLSGISVLGGETHADVTTHITHASGHTQSSQLFKNVGGGRSRAVYQGRITVAAGAEKSDSRQTAKALLMGQFAEADLKPELEIYADDVKCAHGAAVGDLDASSLFYLRARGIAEAEARNMLIRAFLAEAVEEIVREQLRTVVWDAVERALPEALRS